MTDWLEHDGGPQPVADDVWVEAKQNDKERPTYICSGRLGHWPRITGYRILNQHLIDAARLEGIRLGLEAAAREADKGSDRIAGEWRDGCRADNYLQGQSEGMDEAARLIRALDPETIAKEAGR